VPLAGTEGRRARSDRDRITVLQEPRDYRAAPGGRKVTGWAAGGFCGGCARDNFTSRRRR
jgi:hypothetical protein